MTPLLVSITLSRGLNPVPFLLGFCFAANAGSAGTIIGSPQNMIAAEALGLSFNGFLRLAAPPAAAALPIVWAVIALLYRGRWQRRRTGGRHAIRRADRGPITPRRQRRPWSPLAVVAAFVFTDWPRMQVALAGAAVLLLNRRIASSDLLRAVDGDLLLLLMGLFVVNAAFAATGLPQSPARRPARRRRRSAGAPLTLLAVISVLSNVVGNNPAVMLVAPFLEKRRERRRARGGDRPRHRVLQQHDHLRQPRRHHRRRTGSGDRASAYPSASSRARARSSRWPASHSPPSGSPGWAADRTTSSFGRRRVKACLNARSNHMESKRESLMGRAVPISAPPLDQSGKTGCLVGLFLAKGASDGSSHDCRPRGRPRLRVP